MYCGCPRFHFRYPTPMQGGGRPETRAGRLAALGRRSWSRRPPGRGAGAAAAARLQRMGRRVDGGAGFLSMLGRRSPAHSQPARGYHTSAGRSPTRPSLLHHLPSHPCNSTNNSKQSMLTCQNAPGHRLIILHVKRQAAQGRVGLCKAPQRLPDRCLVSIPVAVGHLQRSREEKRRRGCRLEWHRCGAATVANASEPQHHTG